MVISSSSRGTCKSSVSNTPYLVLAAGVRAQPLPMAFGLLQMICLMPAHALIAHVFCGVLAVRLLGLRVRTRTACAGLAHAPEDYQRACQTDCRRDCRDGLNPATASSQSFETTRNYAGMGVSKQIRRFQNRRHRLCCNDSRSIDIRNWIASTSFV